MKQNIQLKVVRFEMNDDVNMKHNPQADENMFYVVSSEALLCGDVFSNNCVIQSNY